MSDETEDPRELEAAIAAFERQLERERAAELQRQREAGRIAEHERVQREVERQQAEADADPIGTHNALIREAGHAAYCGPFDRPTAPQRSPLEVTERPRPPAPVATPSLLDAVEDDEADGTDYWTEVLAQTIALQSSAYDRKIRRLEKRIAALEKDKQKSAEALDLPQLPRLRSVA
jgi:hypothetical protein